MLRILRVTGESLLPEYKEGDYVVITTLPFFFDSIKRGDTVIFRQAPYGTMMKYVEAVDARAGELFVVGSHPQSVDSRHFGAIHQSDLIGKVLWHIRKP